MYNVISLMRGGERTGLVVCVGYSVSEVYNQFVHEINYMMCGFGKNVHIIII